MELSNGMIGQYGNPMDENTEEIFSDESTEMQERMQKRKCKCLGNYK